jgi:ATP-dependent Clp protease ATP-binding subunit ClpB
MNLNNLTIKAQEIIEGAVNLAQVNGHQAIETGHLLKCLLTKSKISVNLFFKSIIFLNQTNGNHR